MHAVRILRPLALTLALAGCAHHPQALRPGAPAPSSPAVAHSESSFAAKDGTQLFEQSWRPASGEAKAVLVIVHGLKDHSDRYAAAAEALVARGYAVHAFDLRGHGRSAGDRVWVRRFDDYLDDVDVFLARVAAAEPGKKIFLFGHSMGGAIVTLDVIDRHPPIGGFILSAPALKRIGVPAPKAAATKLLGTIAPHLAVFGLPDPWFSPDPAVVKDMAADPFVWHRNAPARTAAQLLGAMKRIDRGEASITLPFLDVHGTADKLTNPAGSKQLGERAASKDKTVTIVDGAWHDLLHGPQREQVLKEIGDWMDARL